ncbi:MAG: CRISPR-associated ring nuclease [Caldilineaceae bacterium]
MSAVLIATVDDEYQEVSLTTQLLLEQHEPLTHVVILCQLSDKYPIQQNFDGQLGWPYLVFREIPFNNRLKPEQFDSFTSALFAEIKEWLNKTYRIHLLLSGECKAMTMLGMIVAQLLLGSEDCIWYLTRDSALQESRRLLKSDGDHVELIKIHFPHPIPIPVRFTRLMTSESLDEACAELTNEHQRRLKYFVDNILTKRERDIAILIAKKLPNKKIAQHLDKDEKTIKNQITSIYKKLEEQFAFLANPQLKREFLQRNLQKWLDISQE